MGFGDVRLRFDVSRRRRRVYTPTVKHFRDMQRLFACEQETNEAVPVMTSLGRAVAVQAKFQCEFAIYGAEVSNITRVQKQYGVPIRLEIGCLKPRRIQLVFVSEEQSRIAVILD